MSTRAAPARTSQRLPTTDPRGELGDQRGERAQPVASAFGVHLIRVTARSAPETPPFESVRDEVLAHWQEAELARANAGAVREIVSRYKVEIEAEPR